jgi:hypothetical protein
MYYIANMPGTSLSQKVTPDAAFTFRCRPIYGNGSRSPLCLSNGRPYASAAGAKRAGILFADRLARQADDTTDLRLSYLRVTIHNAAGFEIDSIAG